MKGFLNSIRLSQPNTETIWLMVLETLKVLPTKTLNALKIRTPSVLYLSYLQCLAQSSHLLNKSRVLGASPVAQRLSLHIPLQPPRVCQFGSRVRTFAQFVKPCCGWHPTYKVEEDGHGCQLWTSLPQQKRGGSAADVSSGLIFLKKKKKEFCVCIFTNHYIQVLEKKVTKVAKISFLILAQYSFHSIRVPLSTYVLGIFLGAEGFFFRNFF